MPIRIQDISKRLGISVSTVSKALNNYEDVSQETRERVKQAADEMGYYPSATAKSLRNRRTSKIGMVVNYPIGFVGEYLSRLMVGAALAAENHGYHVILYSPVDDPFDQLTRICRAREVDGVLLLWGTLTPENTTLMNEENMPFVVVARRESEYDAPYAVGDNFQGALELTRYLIAQGHRRIGYTSWEEEWTTNQDRMAGYRQALAEEGLGFDPDLIVPITRDPENRYAAANQLFDLPHPPSAIFAFHDFVAIEVLRAASDRGLRVPEDIAIAGFDNMYASLITIPPLTTVSQPVQEIGQAAVEILLDRINETNHTPGQAVLPVELVTRQST